MKRLLVTAGILTLLCTPCALAAKDKSNGNMKHQGPAPNESAYEHASDNAKFKRAEDAESGKHREKGEETMQHRDGDGHKHMEQDRHRDEATKQKHKGDDGGTGKKMKKTGDDDERSTGHMETHERGGKERSRDREKEQDSDQVQY